MLAVAGPMVVLGLVGSLYSARLGLSHLLVFLLLGMAAGVDGPLGLPFEDSELASSVGHLALAVILLDGGLRTPLRTVRLAWVPASVLATAGVALTSAGVMAAAMHTLGMDWRQGALLGAIVASTDAAAVFAQLSASGVRLPPRVAATIELESGLNDPMAVVLTLSLLALLQPGASQQGLATLLASQLGLGAAGGLLAGWLAAALLLRLPLSDDHDGLTGLLLTALGATVFALTATAGGSGFLAVYLFGIVVAHRAGPRVRPALLAVNGYTWLAEALLFLLLGLLVTPHEMLRFALPALGIAAVLMLLARPLAVALCLLPLRFAPREVVLVGWVGLRGGVPIVLALYPVLAGLPLAYLYFDVAFFVVLCSLLLQGPTLGPLARRLGLDRRDALRATAASASSAVAVSGSPGGVGTEAGAVASTMTQSNCDPKSPRCVPLKPRKLQQGEKRSV